MQKYNKQFETGAIFIREDVYLKLLSDIVIEKPELEQTILIKANDYKSDTIEINIKRFKKACLKLAKDKTQKEEMKSWFEEDIINDNFLRRFILKFNIPIGTLNTCVRSV